MMQVLNVQNTTIKNLNNTNSKSKKTLQTIDCAGFRSRNISNFSFNGYKQKAKDVTDCCGCLLTIAAVAFFVLGGCNCSKTADKQTTVRHYKPMRKSLIRTVPDFNFNTIQNDNIKNYLEEQKKSFDNILYETYLIINSNLDLFNNNVNKFASENVNPKEIIDTFVHNMTIIEDYQKFEKNIKHSGLLKPEIVSSILNPDKIETLNIFLPDSMNNSDSCNFKDINLYEVNLFENMDNPTTPAGHILKKWKNNLSPVISQENSKLFRIIDNNYELFCNNIAKFNDIKENCKDKINNFINNINLINNAKNDEKENQSKCNKLSNVSVYFDTINDYDKYSKSIKSALEQQKTLIPISSVNINEINLFENINTPMNPEGKTLSLAIEQTKNFKKSLELLENNINSANEKRNRIKQQESEMTYRKGYNEGYEQGYKDAIGD